MSNTGFQEAVEIVCQEDRRYNPEAYAFLRDSLEATIKRRKKSKKEVLSHVGAAELLDGFRLHALAEFGPMALMVLNYWGLTQTSDVGQMVFNLVQVGIFGKTDEDTVESFRDLFDFQEAFVSPFRPIVDSLNGESSLRVESLL
jgi:uncharacterized repeat protein (TIGR04138 family)